MEIKDAEEAKEIVYKWITENGHSIEKIEDKNATFNFKIDYPIGKQTRQHIVQPKQIGDLLLIVDPIIITSYFKERLKNMEKNAREKFLDELRKEFIFKENQFEFKFDEKGILSNVIFTYPIYFDGLTKNNLYRGLNINLKTRLYLYLILKERFGEPQS